MIPTRIVIWMKIFRLISLINIILRDTYHVVAHFNYVLSVRAVLVTGTFAGITRAYLLNQDTVDKLL